MDTRIANRCSFLVVNSNVSPWLEPDDRFHGDAGALERIQAAAVTFRRSGVQVVLDSDDEQRIFAAVVRPERQRVSGDAGPEIARLQKEIAAADYPYPIDQDLDALAAEGAQLRDNLVWARGRIIADDPEAVARGKDHRALDDIA